MNTDTGEKWVGHKTGLVVNQAQTKHGVQKGCANSCESATLCQGSQSQKDFRGGGEEHPGLCFPAQITVAESNLTLWICVQPSR